MKVKLKESLSLFRGYLSYQAIQAGNVSADIETLSSIIKHVTNTECNDENIFELLKHIEDSEPSWFVLTETFLITLEKEKGISGFTQLLACISSEYSDLVIDFGKCPLLKPKRSNYKEQRKPFHINVPNSIYTELTGAVKSLLVIIRKDEKSRISHKDDKVICKFDTDGVIEIPKEKEIEWKMILKITLDKWSFRRSAAVYYASKGPDMRIEKSTVSELFEEIYGTKEFNEDLKPIK